jgi:outer membrane protein, heavy metal efflux system
MRILIFLFFIQSTELLNDRVLVQEHQHRQSGVIPLTLAQIEGIALDGNREIRAMNERVTLAKAAIIPAMGFEDPSFTYRAWGTPLLQPWNLNQTQHMFMFNQNLPAAGKRELRYVVANQAVDVAEAQLEAVKLDVKARVRGAFYDLLRNQDELRLHDQHIALTQQAVAAARIKYTVGRVPQQDVLKAQIAVTKLADHVAMFLQDGDLARVRLNTLMGRDPEAPLEVIGEYVAPAALPAIAELKQIALENRPELKAIEAETRQLETKVRLAEKNYKPDVSVSAGYMLMPSGATNRNGYMAELSFNLPWLNRSKHDAETAEAHAAVNVRRADLAVQQAAIFQEIQETLVRAKTAARLVEIYRDTLRPQAQATFRAASAAYQTDQTDLLNLIDSQNTTLDVDLSYYRALADFDGRVVDIERAIGAPLPRDRTGSNGGGVR